MTTKAISIVDALEHSDWKVDAWHIRFLLSKKLLHEVRKLVKASNRYEDPTVAAIWTTRLRICFNSVKNYYRNFGVLPQVGDRLFDEASGLIILERSIDGTVMTITFTLGS